MDIEIMPHMIYFTSNSDTVTKINQIPYQTIQYNENGMFSAKLMNDIYRQFYHYALTTNFLFYTHTPKRKVTLPYTQEEV